MIVALLLALSALLTSTTLAQVRVDTTLDGPRLDAVTTYLEDPTGRLTLAEVRATSPAAFKVCDAAGLNFGLRRTGALWVRIPVENPSDQTRRWLLEVGYAHIDRLTLFAPGASGTELHEAGDLLPFVQRELHHPNFVFVLDEPARSERVLYLRAATQGVLFLPLRAWEQRRFTEHAYLEWTILFGFYGIVLVMATYNLFLFALSRVPEYGLFTLVVLAEGLTQAASYGHVFQWLLPGEMRLAQRAVPFALTFSVFANCLFGRYHVTLVKLPLGVQRTLDVLTPVTALCAVLSVFAPFPVLPVLIGFCYLGLVPFAAILAISWRLQRTRAHDIMSSGWATSVVLGWLSGRRRHWRGAHRPEYFRLPARQRRHPPRVHVRREPAVRAHHRRSLQPAGLAAGPARKGQRAAAGEDPGLECGPRPDADGGRTCC